MTLSAFLWTYLLGGVTFIPLLLAAIFIPAWHVLPVVKDGERDVHGDGQSDDGAAKRDIIAEGLDQKIDGAASGTFAVLRKLDYQAAIAALVAKQHGGSGTGAGNHDASADSNGSSESVYQSMYRSVFDRSKPATSSTLILEREEAAQEETNGRPRKAVTPVNTFYIVLRHGHLMLYDSAAQLEVRHVISLAHHTVSLVSGDGQGEADMKDSDLFIRRTAIVLSPIIANGHVEGPDQPIGSRPSKKPFYLFCYTCIDKENFYHALLTSRKYPPIPLPLDTDAIIKLQSNLHSTSSLTPETRGLNALISRVFLALHHTDRLNTIVKNKIERKIARASKPAFIASLAVQSIDLGDAAPIISNVRLKDLHIDGDTTVALDLRYSGGVKVTVAALARLDLGSRFKTRTADLLLSVSLTRLHGHMLLRIKAPPSNRLWFSFESLPDMDIKVEPVVSSRQITYTFILKAIEDRIRSIVSESLVKPNWDDVSFFDTRGDEVRGGIWMQRDRTKDGSEAESEPTKPKVVKAKSMPATLDNADLSVASSGFETTANMTSVASSSTLNELKRRSVTTLPGEKELHKPSRLSRRPLRTPSFTSPAASTPSIQLDESLASVNPAMPSESRPRSWHFRTPESKKDAIESMRDMRDRALAGHGSEDRNEEGASQPGTEGEESDTAARRSHRHRPKRMDTNTSTTTAATTSSSASSRSQRQQEAVQRGKTLLAAATTATNAAKTWSWNALQSRTKGGRSLTPEEPIGRGHPLPPPGMPLPGPQKSWLPTGVGTGSVKRKVVPPSLPPRRGNVGSSELGKANAQVSVHAVEGDEVPAVDGTSLVTDTSQDHRTTSDEFGPWRHNSGAGFEDLQNHAHEAEFTSHEVSEAEQATSTHDSGPTDQPEELQEPDKSAKRPPPLPARPQSGLPDPTPRVRETHAEVPEDVDSTGILENDEERVSRSEHASEESVQDDHLLHNATGNSDVEHHELDTNSDAANDLDDPPAIAAPVDDDIDEGELKDDLEVDAAEAVLEGQSAPHEDEEESLKELWSHQVHHDDPAGQAEG